MIVLTLNSASTISQGIADNERCIILIVSVPHNCHSEAKLEDGDVSPSGGMSSYLCSFIVIVCINLVLNRWGKAR